MATLGLSFFLMFVTAALPFCGFLAGCGSPDGETAVEITTVEYPDGSVRTGDPAAVTVRIKNTGAGERASSWVGFSVRDPSGGWRDAPAVPVVLGSGEESDALEFLTQPLEMPGYYGSRVSVWGEDPGADDAGAEHLAVVEEASAFGVSSTREEFDALKPGRWEASARDLGRGGLSPENVGVEDGRLRLTLPAGSTDGAQVESGELHGPGFYAARIQVPDAPSSITGFFLYAPPDFESEIDVEIYNDPSGRVLFTTYAGGEQTHTETAQLPFDPTEGFHDYAFFYDEDGITFYVDGEPVQEYEGGLPGEPMKLYVNSWFPKWLSGEEPATDRYAYVDWIQY